MREEIERLILLTQSGEILDAAIQTGVESRLGMMRFQIEPPWKMRLERAVSL